MAIESGRLEAVADEGNPVCWAAGATADGEYHCSDCGYGVAVRRALPTCPMCGGATWEQAGSASFTQALR